MNILPKVTISAVLRWVVCVGYGALIGFLAITDADVPPDVTDNTAYQNFGIMAGAAVGFGVCLLAHLIYKLYRHQIKIPRDGFLFLLCVVGGVVIGFAAAYWVHLAASSYGLINAPLRVVIVGSLVPALIGGLIPAVFLKLTRF